MTTFVVIEFFRKWIEEGRLPREELRIRWWIAALGLLVILPLLAAILVALMN